MVIKGNNNHNDKNMNNSFYIVPSLFKNYIIFNVFIFRPIVFGM